MRVDTCPDKGDEVQEGANPGEDNADQYDAAAILGFVEGFLCFAAGPARAIRRRVGAGAVGGIVDVIIGFAVDIAGVGSATGAVPVIEAFRVGGSGVEVSQQAKESSDNERQPKNEVHTNGHTRVDRALGAEQDDDANDVEDEGANQLENKLVSTSRKGCIGMLTGMESAPTQLPAS